jgi:hypothetical protein
MGILKGFPLFGMDFVSLGDAAALLGFTYDASEDGTVVFGQARLTMGETGFTSYGQSSNLRWEPIIYRGGVYIYAGDVRWLGEGVDVTKN